jgi:sigma-E factor negative regulatory protein RseC
MIEERARVVAVDGDSVLLQTQRQSSCGSCEVKSGCGTSVLAGIVGQKVTQLKLPNTLGAKPGDEVLLGMSENALVTGSLLVYMIPLVMLLLGALTGELVATQLGMDAELMPVVGGALGFVLAILLVRGLLHKTATGLQMQPVMLRILAK